VLENHSGWVTKPRKKFDEILIRFDTTPACDTHPAGHLSTAITALTHSVARLTIQAVRNIFSESTGPYCNRKLVSAAVYADGVTTRTNVTRNVIKSPKFEYLVHILFLNTGHITQRSKLRTRWRPISCQLGLQRSSCRLLLLLLLQRVAVYWPNELVILAMCRWLQTTVTYNATLVVCRGVVCCTVFRHLCLHPEAAYNKKYIYCRPINGHGAYASTHYWGTQ